MTTETIVYRVFEREGYSHIEEFEDIEDAIAYAERFLSDTPGAFVQKFYHSYIDGEYDCTDCLDVVWESRAEEANHD